jgi:hypothetical protein
MPKFLSSLLLSDYTRIAGICVVFVMVLVLDIWLFRRLAWIISCMTGRRAKQGASFLEGILIELLIGGCTYTLVCAGFMLYQMFT